MSRIAARSTKKVDPFYLTKAWESVRKQALTRDGYRCAHCQVLCLGKKRNKPSPHVDHIKPRKQHPELALDIANLRTLCHSCHSKVSAYDKQDRPAIGLDGYPVVTNEA